MGHRPTSYSLNSTSEITDPHIPHFIFSLPLLLLSQTFSLPPPLSLSLSLSLSLCGSWSNRLKMGPIVLTQLATGLGVLAGLALVKLVMDQKTMASPFLRCPSCNGTGQVSCLCSCWSDSDTGRRTCSKSGRMACSSYSGTRT